jgi:hypothetical protein
MTAFSSRSLERHFRCLRANGLDELVEIIHNPFIEAVELSAPVFVKS